jgi:hypothetical protein
MAAKSLASTLLNLAGSCLFLWSRRWKSFSREQTHILGEHAEHELFRRKRKWAARWGSMLRWRRPSAMRAKRSAACGLGGEAGLEGFGVGEEAAERFPKLIGRLVEVGERKGVDALEGVGEVGVNLEAVEVADDQERRVFEVFAVAEKLLVGVGEVSMFALVLPAEVAAHPDVGPAAFAGGLGDAALESVMCTFGVGFGGLGLTEQVTEIAKVLLVAAALGEIGGAPFCDELLGGHARKVRRTKYEG